MTRRLKQVNTSHYDGGMVDRISGVPRYQQVASDLREKIAAGTYAPGAPLPSERALVDEYAVSRPTIREAIGLLRSEGVVIAEHGRGVFVRPPRSVQRLARNRLSKAAREANSGAFLGDAKAGGWTPSSSVKVRLEAADADTAARLGIEPGAEVTVRDRLMRANGQPVQLAVSYLPRELTRDTLIEEVVTGPGGIYARLEDAGHTFTHFTETVSARMPSRDEAITLQLAEGVPVICVVRVAHSETRPLEVNRMVLAADRYELHYELPAE